MNKCNPETMRKNVELVEAFRSAGIDFVPVPVISDEHKEQLVLQLNVILKKINDDIEEAEA